MNYTTSRPVLAGIACAVAALAPAVAYAQAGTDLQALRAELDQIRQQYESRIQQLEQRIEQLEAAGPATPAGGAAAAVAAAPVEPAASGVPVDAPPPAGRAASASAFNPAISVILNGSYSNLSQDPEDYRIAGFLPAGDEIGPGERGFGLGESEITFSASVDPYFDAALTAALTTEGEVEIEEAFFRTTALPAGTTLKGGRFFSGIGYLNEIHSHAWDFADQPLAYQAFFGGSLKQDGVQLKWLAPTDLFLEFGAELGSGDAFPGTRDDGNGFNTWAVFAHAGGDLGDSVAWRAGLSYVDADATGRAWEDTDSAGADVANEFTGSSQTWIADATFKYAPGGDARRNALEVQAEYLQREEDGVLGFDTGGAGLLGRYDSDQDAWYAQAVYRFTPRWRAGLRYDSLDSGTPRIGLVRDGTLSRDDFPLLAPGTPTRVTVMADWSPSEFTRLRAQYAWDDARDSGDTDEQWLLQYIYAIGAHGAHKF